MRFKIILQIFSNCILINESKLPRMRAETESRTCRMLLPPMSIGNHHGSDKMLMIM